MPQTNPDFKSFSLTAEDLPTFAAINGAAAEAIDRDHIKMRTVLASLIGILEQVAPIEETPSITAEQAVEAVHAIGANALQALGALGLGDKAIALLMTARRADVAKVLRADQQADEAIAAIKSQSTN